MVPPNAGGAAGNDWPSIVDVALGDPGVPVTCCAIAGATLDNSEHTPKSAVAARTFARAEFFPLIDSSQVAAAASSVVALTYCQLAGVRLEPR
jgi:hypothetical protein